MKKSLLAIAIVTFSLGITEFGMMGILEDVADSLGITVVEAGHFITAYSAGVAVGAPLLVLLRKWPLKKLLLLLASVVLIGNVCTATSPGYLTMLVSRFISGLPHGAFFGAAAIVAERIADEGRKAESVAIAVGGMTVANMVGVPLATFLSNTIDWRVAFIVVSACALIGLIAIKSYLPALPALPDTGIKGQFHFLSKPGPWLVYAGVFFGQASVYCWLSYIAPMMTQVTHFSQSAMTWIMVVVGFGMVVGNSVAGKLSDRYSASLVTATVAGLLVIIMPALYLCAGYKIPSVIFAFIAPACLFGIGGPLQYLIVRYAKGGEMLGGAGIQIAFNVSNALSASLGGLAIHQGFGYASPALVGVPFALIGSIALFILYKKYPVSNK
ncbi:MAG: MFS transporter [Bacteroidales bacterium]|nr:MFS transporter [Bacteroidales bacterium]